MRRRERGGRRERRNERRRKRRWKIRGRRGHDSMVPSSFSGFSSRGRGIIGAGKVLTREKRETRERNRQRRRTGTGRGYWGYLQLVFSRRENERQSLMILTQIESTLRWWNHNKEYHCGCVRFVLFFLFFFSRTSIPRSLHSNESLSHSSFFSVILCESTWERERERNYRTLYLGNGKKKK